LDETICHIGDSLRFASAAPIDSKFGLSGFSASILPAMRDWRKTRRGFQKKAAIRHGLRYFHAR
jgi:hypothetical protein